MEKKREEQKVRFDPDKIVVLGPTFDFWLSEEDDIYDEFYGETKAGASIPDGGRISGQTGNKEGPSGNRSIQ